MHRIITLIAALFVIAACAHQPGPSIPPIASTTCSGNAPNPGWIKYGNSEISAKKVTKIKAGKFWKINLMPDAGYETAVVTISGKNPTQTWLTATGTEDANGELYICVPNSASVGDEFYYMITVQFVGQLDPRADVVN